MQYLDKCLNNVDSKDHEAIRMFHLAYFCCVLIRAWSTWSRTFRWLGLKWLKGVGSAFGLMLLRNSLAKKNNNNNNLSFLLFIHLYKLIEKKFFAVQDGVFFFLSSLSRGPYLILISTGLIWFETAEAEMPLKKYLKLELWELPTFSTPLVAVCAIKCKILGIMNLPLKLFSALQSFLSNLKVLLTII